MILSGEGRDIVLQYFEKQACGGDSDERDGSRSSRPLIIGDSRLYRALFARNCRNWGINKTIHYPRLGTRGRKLLRIRISEGIQSYLTVGSLIGFYSFSCKGHVGGIWTGRVVNQLALRAARRYQLKSFMRL